MKQTKVILLAISLLTLSSCKDNKEEIKDFQPTNQGNLKSIQHVENLLFTGGTRYALFAWPTDVSNIYYDNRYTPVSPGEFLVATNSAVQVKAGGYLMSGQYGYPYSTMTTALFGNDIEFIIGSSNFDTTKIRIPDTISITMPPVADQSDIPPFCYYNNFTLGWNADNGNEHGILIMIEWTGSMFSEPSQEDIIVRNVDILPEDDGEEVLSEGMFDGIPDNAIATLTILRGNIEILVHNGDSVKVGGVSMRTLPMIVVRDMSDYH